MYMFRSIWESRQSADCLGILRILRLPRQSAIGMYNWTACSLGELGSISGTQRFLLSTLYIVIFLFGILSSRGMENKKHRKENSKFSHYETETRSSSAYI